MTLYSVALFIHVAGAMLLMVLLAFEGLTLRGGGAARLNRVLGPISLLTILVPGFYMAAQIGWQAWTAVGLASYVGIAAGGAYTGISVMRGRMSAGIATVSWLVRAGIATGVVFDMTVKPAAIVSIAAVLIGVLLALAVSVPTVRLVRAA